MGENSPNLVTLFAKQTLLSSGLGAEILRILLSTFFSAKKRQQGCQMVCFQTKNPNSGKIFRFSDWKMLI
jgi:hypothetical protein